MAQKKADSPIAETTRMDKDRTKKAVEPFTNSRTPKRAVVDPATNVPERKRLRAPMELMNLPKIGEKMMVVMNTDPYT